MKSVLSKSRITAADFSDQRLRDLIREHLAAMHEHSPPGAVHALDISALNRPDLTLFVLWCANEAVGMGAIRRLDAGSFEIKSMRVRAGHLRRGHGRRLLEHLIAEASAQGAGRLSLETGSGAAFEPALALYRSRGFSPGPAFAGYEASDFNQFLHLAIPAGTEIDT